MGKVMGAISSARDLPNKINAMVRSYGGEGGTLRQIQAKGRFPANSPAGNAFSDTSDDT